MIRKNVQLCYFTGTGNTRLMALTVSGSLTEAGFRVHLTEIRNGIMPETDPEEETLGILFPVFGLSLPFPVKAYLKQLPKTKSGTCFLLANAHSNTGESLRHAAGILRTRGYRLLGSVGTYTPSSSLITEETEPEEQAREMRAAAVKKAAEFTEALLSGEPRFESESIGRKEKGMALFFRLAMPGFLLKRTETAASCTSCGLCTRICPMDNITMKNGRPVRGSRCAVCLRCLNFCPENAVRMWNSGGRRQYREPSFKKPDNRRYRYDIYFNWIRMAVCRPFQCSYFLDDTA